MNLKQLNVLITGGSSGIGLEMAKQFIEAGSQVMICGRNAEKLKIVNAQLPGVHIFQCDVTKQEEILRMKDHFRTHIGTIDLLVNNAAIFRRFEILDQAYGLDAQLQEIDINLNGTIRMTHAFLPDLLNSDKGRIVNLTSPSAFIPMAAAPLYSLTKAAIQSWTLSLRKQLQRTSVKVIELNPPAVDTQMNADNPGVEGLSLMPAEKFARIFIRQLVRGKEEIMPSHSGLLKRLRRIAPQFTFNMMNRETYQKALFS